MASMSLVFEEPRLLHSKLPILSVSFLRLFLAIESELVAGMATVAGIKFVNSFNLLSSANILAARDS